MEIWRPIDGFPNYLVSNQGRIQRKSSGRILKNKPAGRGYFNVSLGANNDRIVHRLVAQAFIPNPNGLPQVNHIDCDKSNNCATNLEWVTREGNMKHAFDNGLLKTTACCNPKSGVDHFRSRSVSILADSGMLVINFESMRQAAKLTGIDYSTIHGAVSGKFSSAGGCIWQKNEA